MLLKKVLRFLKSLYFHFGIAHIHAILHDPPASPPPPQPHGSWPWKKAHFSVNDRFESIVLIKRLWRRVVLALLLRFDCAQIKLSKITSTQSEQAKQGWPSPTVVYFFALYLRRHHSICCDCTQKDRVRLLSAWLPSTPTANTTETKHLCTYHSACMLNCSGQRLFIPKWNKITKSKQ